MPATVTGRPYYYSFSKNPITWSFYLSSPGDTGCKLQFKLFADSASDVPAIQRTYETELRPNSDGHVNVNVQDIVDSMIDYNVPVSGADNVLVAKNIKQVSIHFRRVSDADSDPAWVESEDAIYVVKGGIEMLKHDYNNYFYNWHRPNKSFATWQPKNRLVSVADEWWMSFLFVNEDITAPDLTARKLRTYIEWTDGTNETVYDVVPSTGLAYLLYHANVGKIVKDAITDLAGEKLLWRFTVQVVGDVDVTELYSEAYTLYADHRVFYDYKLFNYFNSLGGIDHLRLQAEAEESYNRGFIEADLFASSIAIGAPADLQYFQANFSRLNTFKTDTGYRHTKAEAMTSQEILTSGQIFETFDNSNKYRSIGLLNKNGKLIKSSDKRFAFSIEWRYAFMEQVYTPEVNLGVGFTPCVPASLVGSPSLPNGVVGVPYSQSFNITGSLPFTLDSIVKPSWMTIAINDFTITFGGTPTEEAEDVAVSFDITNCGSVAFSDSINIADPEPSINVISNTINEGDTIRTQVFEVGSPVTTGDTFYVEVYSHNVSVVAIGGDTPATIAGKIRDAVNATSELNWDSSSSAPASGTPGFPPTATASGNQFTLVLNSFNQFAAGAY